MNVVIIEDEPLVAREMQKSIQHIDSSIKILVTLTSVKEAIAWFGKHNAPDLIFSDIQLSDGVSFDIFETLNTDVPIVFTTAFSNYALRAFKLNSVDYLLKPVDGAELKRTLEKFKKINSYAQKLPYGEMIRQVLADYTNKDLKKFKQRFLAHQGSSIIPVDEPDVAMFSFEKIVLLHTRSGKQLVTDYESLDELENLIDPARFFRANRQNILHIDAIESMKTLYTGKLQVMLKNPVVEISVSREKASSFKQWFEKE
ncbi:MAG TPA: LytTR family DNA-binding domain-containing protein [Flavobacteriales bacterium]|nr:LytTR family DNA-binding domain-containing protein [Flavobacteriales bacterium]